MNARQRLRVLADTEYLNKIARAAYYKAHGLSAKTVNRWRYIALEALRRLERP